MGALTSKKSKFKSKVGTESQENERKRNAGILFIEGA